MKNLYDAGYNEIRDPKLLEAAAEKLDAIIFDARFSPFSKNPAWSGHNLEKAIGDRYSHVKSLGNKNYKGGPIDFVDLDAGLKALAFVLEHKSVILLCACPNRLTCHRKSIADEFEKRTGIASTPLTRASCFEILETTESDYASFISGQLKLL